VTQMIARAQEGIDLPVFRTGELPGSIMWMPPGERESIPFVDGKPTKVRTRATARLAQVLNEQLQHMRALAQAGEGPEPYTDFNHWDGERSSEAQELYWGGDDPKKGGIRLRLAWSKAGGEGVLGRNWRRFSPEYVLAKEAGRDGFTEILGITSNLGGLVNRSAFRDIAPVMARDGQARPAPNAPGGAGTNNNNNNGETMTTEEMQKIVGDALKPISDRMTAMEGKITGALPSAATARAADAGAAGTAPDIGALVTKAVEAAVKPVLDKVDGIETRTAKASAASLLQPHIARGAIGPQDTATIEFWTENLVKDSSKAQAQLAKMPGSRTGRIIAAPANGSGVGGGADMAAALAALEPEHQFVVKAREAGHKMDPKMSDVDCFAAFARTQEGAGLYKDYLGVSATVADEKRQVAIARN
jgi:hypothetical protein